MKFGKLPAKHDLRTLRFEKYVIPSQLPPVPDQQYWQDKLPSDWGEMGNDAISDCTCAAAGHLVMNWTANANGTSQPKIIPDKEIISAYSAVSNYDPQTGNNDNGAYSLDLLNYWKNTGIGDDKIVAFISLENKNVLQVKEAVYIFGGSFIGLSLPDTITVDISQSIWDVPYFGPIGEGAPNPNNGHAVSLVGYDSRYVAFITWGEVKYMTWRFYQTYCDEAYVILSSDWLNSANGKNPAGFDIVALQKDLEQINPHA